MFFPLSRARAVCWFWLMLVLPAPASAQVWVLVDTEALTLEVLDGETSLLRVERVAIGRGGAGRDKLRGDKRTPLGSYRVAWLNPGSRFHFFIGLDYPTRGQVERAYGRGKLDDAEHRRLLRALYAGRLPPQDTALGGYVGIHGLGGADPGLHEISNWTEGCVAMTDDQVDRLRRYVAVGTPVIIR